MVDLKALCEKRRVLFDGGTGSVLVEKGLQAGEKPENWNLLHPDVIEELHLSYIEAGADIIKSNTFGAYTHKFGDKTEEIITAAMQNARNAVKKGGKDTLVALDIGPTGRLIEPLGDLAFEEAVSIFANTIRIGAPFADLVLIETMADLHEIKAAVIAAKENTSLPIVATVALDDHGRLMTGADIDAIVSLLEGLGVSALGVNCGFGPEKLLPFAEQLKKATSLPLVMNPNAGLPTVKGGKTVYDLTPERFGEAMLPLLSFGASIVGGCCGTTPAHIAALKGVVETVELPVLCEKKRTVPTSYNRKVLLGETTLLVGKNINTDNALIADAIGDSDYDTLVDEALDQAERANLLLLSLTEEGCDGEVFAEAIKAVQEVCALPLVFASSDVAALAKACRVYNGRPIISLGRDPSVLSAAVSATSRYGAIFSISVSECDTPALFEQLISSLFLNKQSVIADLSAISFEKQAGAVAAYQKAGFLTASVAEDALQAKTLIGAGVSLVFADPAEREIADLFEE